MFWGYNVQPGDYSQQYCIIYLKVAKRVDLKKVLIIREKKL